jgi:hypothetical protein
MQHVEPACATGDKALEPGVALGITEAPSPSYELRFQTAKTEDPLAETFLTKGGLLGAAAASECTPFSLTHSKHSVFPFLTSTPRLVSIPISRALIETSKATFRDETGKDPVWKGDAEDTEVLLLSDRTLLNVSNCRTCTSINGIPVVPHSAGRAATPLSTLFTTVDARQFTDAHAAHPDVRRVPFRQISLKYTNWGAAAATVGCVDAHVVKISTDAATGAATETPVNVAFFTPQKHSDKIAKVEKILKRVYDQGWATASAAPGTIPNLHKNVMTTAANAGLNGSQYALASSIGDARPSMTPKTAEMMLAAALRTGDTNAEVPEMVEALVETPSMTTVLQWGQRMTTAISAAMSYTPYKPDKQSIVTTGGLEGQAAENWNLDAEPRLAQSTGDCEDLASYGLSFINIATEANETIPEVEMKRDYRHLKALANWSKHYVPGVAIISAFGGHASAQNAETKVGHAALVLTSKMSASTALAAAMHANVGVSGEPNFVPRKSDEECAVATEAQWAAFFPREFVNTLPDNERCVFESAKTTQEFMKSHPEVCPANFIVEGTAFADTATVNDATEETLLQKKTKEEATAATLGPSVLRFKKYINVGAPFYHKIEEIVGTMDSPLFTNAALRDGNLASAHFRIAPLPTNGAITETGVSPKDFAIGAFALLPSWTVGKEEAETLDLAGKEVFANSMPMGAQPQELSERQEANLKQSLRKIEEVQTHLVAPGKNNEPRTKIVATLPFSALIGNPVAMTHIFETIKGIKQAMGNFYGVDEGEEIHGLAVSASTGKELGRFVTLELKLPA